MYVTLCLDRPPVPMPHGRLSDDVVIVMELTSVRCGRSSVRFSTTLVHNGTCAIVADSNRGRPEARGARRGNLRDASRSPALKASRRVRCRGCSSSPNHFLASLSPGDLALIKSHLRPRALFCTPRMMPLSASISGVISLVGGLVDGRFVEAGMFGRNGVVGGGAALDG